MRTTINIDDDLLAVIRSIAETSSRPIGRVASELIRKGLRRDKKTGYEDGLPVFEVRESAPAITLEDVKKDEDGV